MLLHRCPVELEDFQYMTVHNLWKLQGRIVGLSYLLESIHFISLDSEMLQELHSFSMQKAPYAKVC